MSEQASLDRGRAIVERWCVLAEQRLDHLTELFETGRWRRYFSEVTFLENIQEAKLAVTNWRGLLEREASSDNRPIDLSWLGRREPAPAATRTSAAAQPLASAAMMAQSAPINVFTDPEFAESGPATVEQPELPEWTRALDPDLLQQRYPLLRNAM